MQFNIDSDSGSSISGWVAPDNPSAVPKLLVSVPGRSSTEIASNRLRRDIKQIGLHSTGEVGFYIDDTVILDLLEIQELEIRDLESGVLIHRRASCNGIVRKKLFRYDLQVIPKAALEEKLFQSFVLRYDSVERYPFDTLFAILNNQFEASIYASGRPYFYRYQNLLRETNFVTTALLCNPYEDMAERLLFAKYLTTANVPNPRRRSSTGIEPLCDLVRSISFEDEGSLEAAFENLNEGSCAFMSNPIIRVMACKGADETPTRDHVGIALDNLASLDLVGTVDRFEEYKSMHHEVVGGGPLEDIKLQQMEWVERLARSLSRIDQASKLIDLDVALYSHVREAYKNVFQT
jgi:hypothetical protein